MGPKGVIKHTYKGAKAFLKRQETMFIVNFGQFSGSTLPIQIWIKDSQMNADPYGSTTLLQRLWVYRPLLILQGEIKASKENIHSKLASNFFCQLC
jgi:hypothetical protein